MLIRKENSSDIDAIRSLNYAAFKNHPHHEPGAEPTEHLIVDGLRDAGALTLSLVAEDNGHIVGYVAISPVTVGQNSDGWFGLGPVAVLPEKQNKGIGAKLIHTAIEQMRLQKAGGMVVMGEPGYYTRFGFKQMKEIIYPGVPAEYFMALPMGSQTAVGEVSYHSAFTGA